MRNAEEDRFTNSADPTDEGKGRASVVLASDKFEFIKNKTSSFASNNSKCEL